jgi:long-chain acyl-CoA synthetase
VLEVVPRMTVIKPLGVTDVYAFLKEKIDAVNATLPSFQRISKVIVRDTDFVRTPSMKIARNQHANDKK